jgi:deoxyadenosine/deoxycytidine kinase
VAPERVKGPRRGGAASHPSADADAARTPPGEEAAPGAGAASAQVAAPSASPATGAAAGASAQAPATRFIVVEGPIGVGKTSLVRRLAASLGAELLLEQAEQNPFLERFYRNPRAGALPAQLYFLFQRAQQLAALNQGDMFAAKVRVADYLLDKDRIFARLTLDQAEFELYEQVYAKLAIDAPKPDLVVYLQAPPDVLLERIARRGTPYEQLIERRYLERLNEAYARFFHEYDRSPLLIVNAAMIDPANNQADFEDLSAEIARMKRGRLYWNPLRNHSL